MGPMNSKSNKQNCISVFLVSYKAVIKFVSRTITQLHYRAFYAEIQMRFISELSTPTFGKVLYQLYGVESMLTRNRSADMIEGTQVYLNLYKLTCWNASLLYSWSEIVPINNGCTLAYHFLNMDLYLLRLPCTNSNFSVKKRPGTVWHCTGSRGARKKEVSVYCIHL